MRLLVIGASGEIGSAVVNAGLDAGHAVTAFVRSPDKLGGLGARVNVVAGDLTDAEAVADAVRSQDAVISALGSSPDPAQLRLPATAMGQVLAAMEASGVRRLVGLAGAAVAVPGERKPIGGRLTSAVVRLLARNVVAAKQLELAVVLESDLDWTMIRPPRVVDGGPTGRVEIGERLHGFRVTRGDVAAAVVELATGSDWIRRAPYVSERVG